MARGGSMEMRSTPVAGVRTSLQVVGVVEAPRMTEKIVVGGWHLLGKPKVPINPSHL